MATLYIQASYELYIVIVNPTRKTYHIPIPYPYVIAHTISNLFIFENRHFFRLVLVVNVNILPVPNQTEILFNPATNSPNYPAKMASVATKSSGLISSK